MHIYCPKCEAANPEQAELCAGCAHRLQAPPPPQSPLAQLADTSDDPPTPVHIYCPKCEAASPEDSEFCSLCAHPLTAPSPVAEDLAAAGAAPPAGDSAAEPTKARKAGRRINRVLSRKSRSILAICNLAAVLILVAYWAGSRSPTNDQTAKDAAVGNFIRELLVAQDSKQQALSAAESAPSKLAAYWASTPALTSRASRCPQEVGGAILQEFVDEVMQLRRMGITVRHATVIGCSAVDQEWCPCVTSMVRYIYTLDLSLEE